MCTDSHSGSGSGAASAAGAQLTADEARVLGVLIEKALTTPQQYPLTLNAIVLGCNQKNNRWPVPPMVPEWDEDAVQEAVEGLRRKGLAREANMTGSRVAKFRHIAREALAVDTAELVVLAELLLRGPQSVGDIRGRASRMHPLESLEQVQGIVHGLMSAGARGAALVREIPPAPGSRAKLYAQLLCPGLHSGSEASDALDPNHATSGQATSRTSPVRQDAAALAARLAELEDRVTRQQQSIEQIMARLSREHPARGPE
jgi:uncharacterized protein